MLSMAGLPFIVESDVTELDGDAGTTRARGVTDALCLSQNAVNEARLVKQATVSILSLRN